MLITILFSVLTLGTALATGWLTNRLLFRLGFLVILFWQRRRKSTAELVYRWRTPFPLWWVIVVGIIAIINLLLMLRPAMHGPMGLAFWVVQWLMAFSFMWGISAGRRELRQIEYRRRDEQWQTADHPPDTHCTHLAATILPWVSRLVALTFLVPAVFLFKHIQ